MANARLKQQWLFVGVITAIVLIVFFIASNILGKSPQNLLTGSATGRIDTRIVADRTSGASPEDVWISNAEVQISDLSKELGKMRQEIALANKRADERTAKMAEVLNGRVQALEGETADAVMDLAGRISDVKDAPATIAGPLTDDVKLASIRNAPPLTEFIARTGETGPVASDDRSNSQRSATGRSTSFNQGADLETGEPLVRQPFVTSFALTPKATPKAGKISKRTLDKYVPAGSYAPAVVLTGADAKTGTENAANPIPVILKLTGPAVGPADGRRISKINLEGCRVMGSAIADLSSERVSVRLDRISCVRRGEVLEASVAGYVSGQGQQGVRGRLFSRAGPAIKNAAIAAALEGVAGAVGGQGSPVIGIDSSSSSGGLTGLPMQALSGGAEGAASKLAEYYIQRAEQISPVVSLFAGTEVNVVFLEGIDFSGE